MYRLEQVNHAPEKWETWPYDFAGMVQEPDEGLQFLPSTTPPGLPYHQQVSQPCQLIQWESQLALGSVDDDA